MLKSDGQHGHGWPMPVVNHRCGRNTSRWMDMKEADQKAVNVFNDGKDLGYGPLS